MIMLCEIRDRTGRLMMQTDFPQCIPSPADQRELKAAGYKIKVKQEVFDEHDCQQKVGA